MKCLENYNVELVKAMSIEELKVLWAKIVDEQQAEKVRGLIVDMIEVDNANKFIEN